MKSPRSAARAEDDDFPTDQRSAVLRCPLCNQYPLRLKMERGEGRFVLNRKCRKCDITYSHTVTATECGVIVSVSAVDDTPPV